MQDAMVDAVFPVNPLERLVADDSYHRRVVQGVLESYNSNYDVLAELVQNAVDAVEDAHFASCDVPYLVNVHVNLQDNYISVLDTGIGMSKQQIVAAFAPNVSFKTDVELIARRGDHVYRGYKGVGLTFLAYGTNDITIHSKQDDGELVKARMEGGRDWVSGEQDDPPIMVEDEAQSPLDAHDRGTFFRVKLSAQTRPRSLAAIAANYKTWAVILRTRTAIGQVGLIREAAVPIEVQLKVTESNGDTHSLPIDPDFWLPHRVSRQPEFRWLDLGEYWAAHGEGTEIDVGHQRQDGIYLSWDTSGLTEQLTDAQRAEFADELTRYQPHLYAFLPYQASVWSEINECLTGQRGRRHLKPGLLLSVNRQRMADLFEIPATRFETLSRNLFVLVDFHGAKPDQGRKTLQDEVLKLAQASADRALQYIARQRGFLKQAGETPSPTQREVERNHEEWKFNVRTHVNEAPLDLPPVAYRSKPLTEQDVVGLFNQLAALGVFPGVRIFATSQSHTYDCLVSFETDTDCPGLRYSSHEANRLGLSSYVIGDRDSFSTRSLTLEFKNNLDALVEEVEGDSDKELVHIDLCVCWATVSEHFQGFSLEEVVEDTLDDRSYPGVTHTLRRDADGHSIQVIMLRSVLVAIQEGAVPFGSQD